MYPVGVAAAVAEIVMLSVKEIVSTAIIAVINLVIEAGAMTRSGSLEPSSASSSTEYTIHDRAEMAGGSAAGNMRNGGGGRGRGRSPGWRPVGPRASVSRR